MAPGDRVEFTAEVIGWVMLSHTATVRRDDFDGYWILQLDDPAMQIRTGFITDIIVEHEDNLTVIDKEDV